MLDQPLFPKLSHHSADNGVLRTAERSGPIDGAIERKSIPQCPFGEMERPEIFEDIPLVSGAPLCPSRNEVGQVAALSLDFLGQGVRRAANHAAEDRLVTKGIARHKEFRPSLGGETSDKVIHQTKRANESHIQIGEIQLPLYEISDWGRR